MTLDEQLRQNRLVFYQNDIDRIDRCLSEFLKMSGAKSALLVDREGHLVARQGETLTINMDTISALVAGSFAATKEMARLLGEEEFTSLFHQGRRDNIQIALIGERTLLTILFDDRTTLGMVRLYSAEAAKQLVTIFEEIIENSIENASDEEEELGTTYSTQAQGTLDDILGS
jgi:predicted regulator of Ras-like GTPase activity (Roadblock/LC7/MglB family)